mmetsp:Transcript_27973/g.85831  ORF Transcript_27973/g.85831 Transcript_27973/m.85831 type:complete len:374 (-) Transcript_27973:311-1432(-)
MSRPLCRNFQTPGGCRFGSRCHFSHDLNQAKQPPPQQQQLLPPPPKTCVPTAPPPPPPPQQQPQQQPPIIPIVPLVPPPPLWPPEMVLPTMPPQNERRQQRQQQKPCRHFFSAGGCRNGANCRFSHGPAAPQPYVPQPFEELTEEQEALLAAVESRRVPAFGLDVECVATGYTHLDRSVAQIGVVDLDLRPVLNAFVKPTKPVVSYLSPLTGVTKDLVDQRGVSIEEAIASLRAVLPKNAVVVGQNVSQDATWLNISAPNDFASLLDVAALFRVFDATKKKWTYFAQDHVAGVWLSQVRPPGMHHDALGDAATSMLLLHAYLNVRRDPLSLNTLKAKTLQTPRKPSFAVLNPVYEGVCQGNRRLCQCGAAHLS